MRSERRVLVNTAVLSAGEAFGQLANLLLIVGLTRRFGAATLGQYSTAMAVAAVAGLMVGVGTQMLVARESARDPLRGAALIGALLPAQLLAGLIAWATAFAVSLLLLGPEASIGVLACACGYQVLLRVGGLLFAPFRGTEAMVTPALADAGHRILALLLGAVALAAGAAAGTVVGALVASALALLAYAWIAGTRRFGHPRLRIDARELRALLSRAAPYFGLVVVSVLYARAGIVILSMLATPQAVGLYAMADRLMVAALLVPTMFGAALAPALARLAASSPAQMKVLAGRSARLLLVGTVPLATMVALYAGEIVTLVFGAGHEGAAAALRVLAATLPVYGVKVVLFGLAFAHDENAMTMRVRALSLGVFITAAPLLILTRGFVGLAWAMLLCELVQTLAMFLALHKMGVAPAIARVVPAPALAAALTFAAAAAADGIAPPLRAALSGGVMVAALWLVGAVRTHDLRFLLSVLSRRAAGPGHAPPRSSASQHP